ncbi:hypothetical protein B7C51_20565 [Paenibacillus larvae subsp. pulvifaciens]|uniref:Uncharacterized protein n=1 Tax=Paenibacillus larvae subsp. pulvifaciens TaxID=1477 RepID=A0A1V0UXC3_9BACL|nr:hypothetical protein [Paenibacillus larvae]ARF69542.1 hypothetical protein B7C51_19520 [Paenibacillus larvae subsp. pulvifaciens]ARF69718.1 hypothetical protein B7C51_20565 [Paenibacillus larvae subsp. pulvifaciens]
MLKIAQLVLLNDIVRLPKDTLKEICINLNMPNNGTASELVSDIWLKMKDATSVRTQVYEYCHDRIFGGKTSISWYKFTEGIKGVRNLIEEKHGDKNPFDELRIPLSEEISSEPVLIGAAPVKNEGEYFLRYMYKVGVTREIIMDNIETRPRTTTTTVYVNEKGGYIEVRTDPKNSSKIAKSFAQLIKQQVTMEPIQVFAPFGNNAERLADALTYRYSR